MQYTQFLLGRLAKESAGLSQVTLDAQLFGYTSPDSQDQNNLQKIVEKVLEISNILLLLDTSTVVTPLSHEEGLELLKEKREKTLQEWDNYCKIQGITQ